ncbi:MAG: hypothetical protein KDB88_04275 [Flavobacteriales bacterium]|nr:hypothetical protein [Flavobacteriales bacterium]
MDRHVMRLNNTKNIVLIGFAVWCAGSLASCKKEVETVPDNQAPYYDGVPTVVVRNYVNRLFIDLIGREPLDAEMDAAVADLEANGLSRSAREVLVDRLMTSTDFVAGDSSYKHAYYQRQYDLYKARCLEGVSDDVIDQFIGIAEQNALADSLAGNTAGSQQASSEADQLRDLKAARIEYREGLIGINEVFARVVYNNVYDEINMGSFNFVNATFDNLLFRFPTTAEFDAGYEMVEFSQAAILFGQSGQSKSDYTDIVVSSAEFHEGMVRWCYVTFLGRQPSTFEVYTLLSPFINDKDLQRVQRTILTSDEYANFQ